MERASVDHHCPKCGKWFERRDTTRRHLKTHDRAPKPHKTRKKSCLACIKYKVKCNGDRPSCNRCSHRALPCIYEQDGSDGLRSPPSSEHVTVTPTDEQSGRPSDASFALGSQDQRHPRAVTYDNSLQDILDWDPFSLRGTECQMLGIANANSFNDILNSYLGSLPLDDFNFDTFDNQMLSPVAQVSADQSNDPGNGRDSSEDSDLLAGTGEKSRGHQVKTTNLPHLGNHAMQGVPDAPFARQFLLQELNEESYHSLRGCLRAPLTRIPWHPMSLDSFPSKEKMDYLIDLYFANFDQFLPMIHRPTFDPGENPALTLAMCAIGACYSNFDSKHQFAKILCELLRRLLLYMGEYDSSVTRSESHLAAQLLQSVLGKASGSKRLYELGDNNRGILVANARGMGLFDFRGEGHLSSSRDLQSRWESWIRAERSKRIAWCIYVFDASATYYRNCRPNLSLFEVRISMPCTLEEWEAGTAQAWVASHPWTTSTPVCNFLQDIIQTLLERQIIDSTATERSSGNRKSELDEAITRLSDEFHRMLVTTTLVRTVWDARETLLEPTQLPFGCQANAFRSQTMESLLAVLVHFTTALVPAAAVINRPGTLGLAPITDRQFRGLVLRARVSLIAQIISSDYVTDYLALVCSRGPNRSAAIKATEKKLLSWAKAEPSQLRRLAHVGAKLLAISRCYPYHYPREPFDALQGGILLWTMLRLLRTVSRETHCDSTSISWICTTTPVFPSLESHGSRPPPHSNTLVSCRLDWLGHDHAAEGLAVRDWIAKGDGHVLGIHGVADLCTLQGEKQVLLETARVLEGLRVWGITKTYSDIVMRVLQSEYAS